MVIKVKSQLKGFLGLLTATIIPALIMYIIFASAYEPTITGVWTTVVVAGIAIIAYSIFVSLIGVKKYMKKR